MKRFQANEERRAGIESAATFFETQKDGARLSWLEIEQATGIKTTGARRDEGRDWCRRALRRVGRAYAPMPDGLGIELSAPDNAVSIAALRTKRIVGQAKAAHRSATFTLTRHEDDLVPTDREMLRANRSVTAAMVAMSKGAAALPSKKAEKAPQLPRGK